MTIAASSRAVLDFNPTVGMCIEGVAPADPETEPWRVTMIAAPNFGGPPLHVHPHQEESFHVLSGILDVFTDGQWRAIQAGETVTVPAAAPHTIRNLHSEEVRVVNLHTPALDCPRYMARLHDLVHNGNVRSLPPQDPRSIIYLSMLFAAHERTLVSIKPPRRVMRALAFVGRRLGCELP